MVSLVERALGDFLAHNPETPEAAWCSEGQYVMTFVSGSGGASGSLTVLVTARRGGMAGFLLKLARESTTPHLSREYRILQSIHGALSADLTQRVPKALHVGSIFNHPYSIVTILPGKRWDSLLPIYYRYSRERIAAAVVDWLGELGLESVKDSGPGLSQDMLDILDRFVATTGNNRLRVKVEYARDVLREIRTDIPTVVQHGDFWPGNIMLARTGHVSGIVDWEGCSLEGYPGCDCVRMLAAVETGAASTTRLINRYCDVLDHQAVTPATCRALGILDIFLSRRIVQEQCSQKFVSDSRRSLESMLNAIL